MIGGSLSKKYLFVGIVCIAIALFCIAALAIAHEFSLYALVMVAYDWPVYQVETEDGIVTQAAPRIMV